MPVIGSPNPPPLTSGPGMQANSPFVVSPPVTSLYGNPVLSKMRAVSIIQAQYAKLQLQLFNPANFIPVDLTTFGLSTGVGPQGPQGIQSAVSWIKFRFMEGTGIDGCTADATTQSVVDAVNGIISCTVPSKIVSNPGVYQCEAGLFDQYNNFLFSNTFYVLVDRGLFTTSFTNNPMGTGAGNPSLMEIRLAVRDQPEINRLIDDFEYDLADICDAMLRSVLYFNMSQPPICYQYTTSTFPWRFQWMDGIAAHLFEIAATYYRRNHLKHQAAGIAIDDLDREREYLQAWQIRSERWQKWVLMKKAEINMSEGFATFGSDYQYGGGWYGQNW